MQQFLYKTPKIKVKLGENERIFLVLPKEEYHESSLEVSEISWLRVSHVPVSFAIEKSIFSFYFLSAFHSQKKLQDVVDEHVYVSKFEVICISGICVQLLLMLMGFVHINFITSEWEYIPCCNSHSPFHLGSFYIQPYIIYSPKRALNLNNGNLKNYINLFEVN